MGARGRRSLRQTYLFMRPREGLGRCMGSWRTPTGTPQHGVMIPMEGDITIVGCTTVYTIICTPSFPHSRFPSACRVGRDRGDARANRRGVP